MDISPPKINQSGLYGSRKRRVAVENAHHPSGVSEQKDPIGGNEIGHWISVATTAGTIMAASHAAAAAQATAEVEGEEEDEEWRNSDAKRVLLKMLRDGGIPDTADEMPPNVAYWQDPSFAKSPCNQFRDRLNAYRKDLRVKRAYGADDFQMLQSDRLDFFPKSTTDSNGKLRWEGSAAEAMLKADIDEGKHGQMKPAGLKKTRKEYNVEGLDLEMFRGHIHQEVKKRKFIAHLKAKEEKKTEKQQQKKKKKK